MVIDTQADPGGRFGRESRNRGRHLGDWLPAPLRRVIPRELVGFAMLSGLTFAVDLALLWLLRHVLAMPVPAAVSLAYIGAVGLNYLFNRTWNFRSRAPMGRESLRYAVVAIADYLLTVGLTTGLNAAGVEFWTSRLISAAFVVLLAYAAARWFVFRGARCPDAAGPVER
ncbi:GtrA family protein [Paractinoplanes lichenicola]|uniref:GtrA family protein n=1 Tax=Paractinoplanes lichenicola TaxID=2802976 RepID=A0ABS1W0G0_9ACTN|nr:GtrA family protein [Actinoplanes lichenicola]MBL7260199.1 GtrA family protein [Actinoplanes lichenicola]